MSRNLEAFTRKELADILHVTTWTIDHYVRQGKLAPVKLGGRTLFFRDEVEKFIDSHQEEQAA